MDVINVLKCLLGGVKKIEPDSSNGPEQSALVDSALNRWVGPGVLQHHPFCHLVTILYSPVHE